MKKGLAFVFVIILLSALVVSAENSFSINQVFMKSVMKQGENLETAFKITNTGDEMEFSIEVAGMEKIVSVTENNFALKKDESKEIKLLFNSSGSEPGIYAGSLKINKGIEKEEIPIILELQTEQTLFAVNLDVSPEHKEIEKNGETSTGINLINLMDKRTHDVEIDYFILDINGKVVASEQSQINIGTKSAITKNIPLPENIEEGKYIFAVVIKSELTVSTSSYLFSVVKKKIKIPFDISEFLPAIIIVLLFAIMIVIFYIVYERNRLFSELRRQHKSELEFYSKGIEEHKKASLAKAKTLKEKEEIIEEFRDAKEKILQGIKKEQSNQRRELKKLKKEKNDKAIKGKLDEWRRDIYPKALKSAEISQKLKLKLGALKRAYSEGYITKESYEKGESRIERKIKRKSL
ncbi:MAG: hypothetical protein AABX28_00130 [Nanoarchaeota archaeon]